MKDRTTASETISKALFAIDERSQDRDNGSERSMDRAVEIFNAATGLGMSESDGWLFMICLKVARHKNGQGYNQDHFVDIAGYAGLLAESVEQAVGDYDGGQ